MAAAKKVRALTARDLKTVRALPAIPEQPAAAVENVRLALLAAGRSPADPAAVVAAIEAPLAEHLRLIAPVHDAMDAAPDATYNSDDSATVGEHTIRPLRGADLYKLGQAGGIFAVIADLLGSDVETVLDMPLAEFHGVKRAVDFMVVACRLASTSSARPSESPASA